MYDRIDSVGMILSNCALWSETNKNGYKNSTSEVSAVSSQVGLVIFLLDVPDFWLRVVSNPSHKKGKANPLESCRMFLEFFLQCIHKEAHVI